MIRTAANNLFFPVRRAGTRVVAAHLSSFPTNPNQDRQQQTASPAANAIKTINIPVSQLKPGYQALHTRLNDLFFQGMMAAVVSPVLSGAWLVATEQLLANSVVATAVLAAGGASVAGSALQIKRIKKYARLSMITNETGPAESDALNQQIRQIIAGNNPTVKLTTQRLKVSGPLGDLQYPSQTVQNTLACIHAMNRIVLPDCVLTTDAKKHVDLTHDRWLARLIMPFSILNLVIRLLPNSKKFTADDYVVLATSAHNIYDYFKGPSVFEARAKFTALLSKCDTPQEVIKTLIDHKLLDEGGMSFLTEWLKNQDSLAVRVGRTGTAVLYKERTSFFGGPYPAQFFPRACSSASADTQQSTKNHVPPKP